MELSIQELAAKYSAAKDANYLSFYASQFDGIRHQIKNVIELGVQGGGSVKMWRDYFPKAQIFGVDIDDCSAAAQGERIHFFQGRQEDGELLKMITDEIEGGQFDIIIDDAAHFGLYSKLTYEHLFDGHLKPGGTYIIEDWGTGYWDDWPDGSRPDPVPHEMENRDVKETKFIYREDEATGLLPRTFHSHQSGMVGFVKQLVDESHHGAIKTAIPRRTSKFQYMTVTEGVVLIKKKA
ncbi:hypothetical protein ASD01_21585 [Ensifer sp. Root423]|uniref:class I SAM-dependent methyltransferase n=1 Tax=Ensifer sp. Root423 TaxID=1736534 RepID=UPI0007162255|nr:class I SAM-dependent methyltransferase [Ensifer sp. Root423]KQX27701.1 hypothetical protein ASD01_21585 [Ensifer sp. Root423]